MGTISRMSCNWKGPTSRRLGEAFANFPEQGLPPPPPGPPGGPDCCCFPGRHKPSWIQWLGQPNGTRPLRLVWLRCFGLRTNRGGDHNTEHLVWHSCCGLVACICMVCADLREILTHLRELAPRRWFTLLREVQLWGLQPSSGAR